MSPEQTLESYVNATRAHDLERTLQYVAEDAIFLFSNETQHVGKEAVKAALEHNFQTIRNESYVISTRRWLAQSVDVAVCVFEFHWEGEIRNNKVSGHGRGTCVLRREKESWMIVHEHLSKGSLGLSQ